VRRTARGWRTSGGGMLDFRRPRSTRPRNASGRASEHRAIVTVERLSDRGTIVWLKLPGRVEWKQAQAVQLQPCCGDTMGHSTPATSVSM